MKKQILYGMLGFLSLLGFAGVFTEARGFLGFFAFAVDFQYFFLKSDEMLEAQLAMVPRVLVPVDADTAQKLMRITDALEELDDVQNVYTNADFPEDFDPEA